MPSPPKPVFTVQVRALVEFTLRRGDLGGEGGFVGPRRALAGTRGHQRVQRSRPPGYQKEVPLRYELTTDDLCLCVQGRLDGVLARADPVVLEEIKTVLGAWDGRPDPLHWAQAKCYGFIYVHTHGLDRIEIQLTYLHVETGALTEFREAFSRGELTAFFEPVAALYLDWLRERVDWCRRRDASIRALNFPFPAYRPGQRDLAVAAYRTMARGGRLFVEAPTGTGKTVSVLFPAVKALAEGKVERIFYLTARTVGRTVVEKACDDLRGAGLRLRTATLTAKEKLCVRDGQRCDMRTCPLAVGYYDRVRSAMRAALAFDAITRTTIEAVGQAHQVCPFELGLEVSVWVDAVVCDYNYVFDPQVYLRRHFTEEAGAYAFLVDEAHNLVDRARAMYSAELDAQEIRDVRRAIRDTLPRCARALSRLGTACRKLRAGADSDGEPDEAVAPATGLDLFDSPAVPPAPEERPRLTAMGQAVPGSWEGARASRECPSDLIPPLETALELAEAWLARNEAAPFRDRLLELYFRLQSFRRTLEHYDERYRTMITAVPDCRVRLFCLDPSVLLRQALGRGRSAVFFSATLTPTAYFRDLLGGGQGDPTLRIPSPFDGQRLEVLVHDRIRTTFKARGETLGEVVQALGAVVRAHAGNYLVYLPSYQYLLAVQARFQTEFPDLPLRAQRPGMTEPERDAFLAAFAHPGGGTLVGFAVLGGVFGEGIDLVGDHLIGALVVGVGLPQICCERDLIRDHFEEQVGAGFDYAYLFPGMNRVLQAVGRVIRTETDRGVALLLDTRFAEARYRALFPGEWRPVRVRSVRDLESAVDRFWRAPG